MLFPGSINPVRAEAKKKEFRKNKTQTKKVEKLSLDQQVKCYARIVVNQLFDELGLDDIE